MFWRELDINLMHFKLRIMAGVCQGYLTAMLIIVQTWGTVNVQITFGPYFQASSNASHPVYPYRTRRKSSLR